MRKCGEQVQNVRGGINIKRKILYGFSGGAILSVIGLAIGLITGMNIGGNSHGFEFMGGIGYEGAGYLGAIIGAVIGLLLGVFFGIKLLDRAEKNKNL